MPFSQGLMFKVLPVHQIYLSLLTTALIFSYCGGRSNKIKQYPIYVGVKLYVNVIHFKYNEIKVFVEHDLVTLHLDWVVFYYQAVESPLNTYGPCGVGEEVLMATKAISTFCIRAVCFVGNVHDPAGR